MERSIRKRAVSYLRAAKIEMGNFDSLIRQKATIKEYCLKNNIELVNVFWDVSSGNNFNRKGWKELEVYLSNNLGRAQLLISVDSSRIGRNYALFATEQERFKGLYDVDFCFCADRSKLQDLTTEQLFGRLFSQPIKGN
ncbi:recombinase family protein [Chitinophaga pollutisoli]|uniref:Recombinase family protein n=1 Tax=Chitinophaga pollutisoli TaxID=3133966 RepID=A0ABZ2YQQ4_9BACT|nr:recombinase family protein [Niabella sp.]